MHSSSTSLTSPESARLIKRLCAHWSHKLKVEAEDGLGRIDFGESRCLLTADHEQLHIKLDCPDAAAAKRMQQAVFDHLKRMAKAALAEPIWSNSHVE